MCGRYQLVQPGLFTHIFGVAPHRVEALALLANADVRSTQHVPVVLDERELALMRWGFLPSWAQGSHRAMINARAETIQEKPMFRRAFRAQRCVIPATGFYEWQAATAHGTPVKTPYLFTVQDQELFAFAGIWDTAQDIQTCAIITTAANALVAPIHDRMPVILHREDIAEWLDPALRDVNQLGALLAPYPAEAMTARPTNPAALRA
jgi:putative SOS response-associated peptidase YedK